MNKDTQKKLSKIFVLTDLLIQEIDEPPKVPTKSTKIMLDKAKALREDLLVILDGFYQEDHVRRSNFFITMQNKIEYIFQKEYK